jgi:hypothetical protein
VNENNHHVKELPLLSTVAALVDSERASAAGAPKAERVAFAEACRKLGFNVHLTERRATENYFLDRAVKAVKGDKYSALGPHDRLKDARRWPGTELRTGELPAT